MDAGRCLVVEDAPAGLRSGRAAGAATLAVVTTGTPEEVAPEADLVVPDLSHVAFDLVPDGVRVRVLAAGGDSGQRPTVP